MTPWKNIRPKLGSPRYAYLPDPRFELRLVLDSCGKGTVNVWALYDNSRRVWEVHAMANIGYVRADAEEWIKEVLSFAQRAFVGVA